MAAVATLSTTEIVASANELLASHSALIAKVRAQQQQHRRQLHSLQPPPSEVLRLPLLPSPSPSPPPEESPPPSPPQRQLKPDLPPIKRARAVRYHNYIPEEETIRNDYSQRYVDGGEWPQNWVLGAEPEHRFEEYPKQQRLLNLKKASVSNHSLPPSYLPYSQLSTLSNSKFDCILLDPPFSSSFTWDNLQELPVPSLAADPSFVFLWVGSGAGEGLERGREILAKWGYRRCEDVVWVKTNKTSNKGPGTDPPTTSLLTRTKQHCLIGIRGTVRRSTDSWFVHCNVDTDVIIWEGDPSDPTRKPPEMYTLIENFCLGLRRLEIFGRPSSLRRGWVTVLGPNQEEQLDSLPDGTVHVAGNEGGRGTLWTQSDWDEGVKALMLSSNSTNRAVVPMTSEIDALRPKSPVRPGQNAPNHGHSGSSGQNLNNQNSGLTATPMHMGTRFNSGGGGGGGGGGGSRGALSGGTMMGPSSMNNVQPMVPMGVQAMMGNVVNVEEMMGGAWAGGHPGMANMNGMNAMNLGGMQGVMGGNMQPGMGNVNMGNMQSGIPMNMMGQMGQMGMNPAGFGQMFNPAAMGQFGHMEGGWEGDGMGTGMNPGMAAGMGNMGNMGMPNMMSGVNMQGMHPGGHMGMGQWGPGGNF
ncbi:MT-A70-domain-containing protein [Coprinopsis marcescibilis]|uniref:MT-A70-domain-containing protein n=1 Tax=Coprinopsis marcescibilis TaxID=230819 RepID=A0A5C3L998_COPMA|nr:MT-A70-domain-containing protein [Coprinopsis marcescibilis]